MLPEADIKTIPFQIKETGVVKGIKKIIVRVEGLPTCMNGQMVNFDSGVKGLIMDFDQKETLVLILGDEAKVKAGELVYSKRGSFNIPVGDNFLGRIVNSLGFACDGKPPVVPSAFYPIFREAPSAMDRTDLKEQLISGVRIIDSITPLAKGQRQLIMGNRISGKTAITNSIILNQKDKNVICIYCHIGKSSSSLSKVIQLFQQSEVFKYTIIVSAGAAASLGEQYLAPYTAASIGEYFMYNGQDVLVVFDDLTKHAWCYRELSLLMERPPGREAYPGDIYYIHSQLLERAAKLNSEVGGGSMTFLPIVETLEGDVTGYIPSNLISMTDGQIYLNTTLFNEGFRPAVDFNLSVSIVGSRVHNPILKQLTSKLRFEYVEYRKLLSLSRLKADLSASAEEKIRKGKIITELFIQDKNEQADIEETIILLYAFEHSFLNNLSDKKLRRFKKEVYNFTLKFKPSLIEKLKKEKKLTVSAMREIDKCLREFFKK